MIIQRDFSPLRYLRLHPGLSLEGGVIAPTSRVLLASAFAAMAEARPSRRTVLIPSFICSTLVDAVIAAGLVPSFYGIGDNLSYLGEDIDVALRKDPLALVFVDFFGLPARPERQLLESAKAREVMLVRDGAHAFLSLMAAPHDPLQYADLAVFSIHKALRLGAGAIGFGANVEVCPGMRRFPVLRGATKAHLRQLLRRRLSSKVDTVALKQLAPQPIAGLHQRLEFSSSILRGFLRHVNFIALIEDVRVCAESIAREVAGSGELEAVFDENRRSEGVLQWFPVNGKSQQSRDELVFELRSHGIDAHLWPHFSNMSVDTTLWSRLALLPIHPSVPLALKRMRLLKEGSSKISEAPADKS